MGVVDATVDAAACAAVGSGGIVLSATSASAASELHRPASRNSPEIGSLFSDLFIACLPGPTAPEGHSGMATLALPPELARMDIVFLMT